MSLLRIRLRGDGKYVLGEEKPDEVVGLLPILVPITTLLSPSLPPSPPQPFTTVLDLVNHHKKHPLVLKSGGELKLLYECPS